MSDATQTEAKQTIAQIVATGPVWAFQGLMAVGRMVGKAENDHVEAEEELTRCNRSLNKYFDEIAAQYGRKTFKLPEPADLLAHRFDSGMRKWYWDEESFLVLLQDSKFELLGVEPWDTQFILVIRPTHPQTFPEPVGLLLTDELLSVLEIVTSDEGDPRPSG